MPSLISFDNCTRANSATVGGTSGGQGPWEDIVTLLGAGSNRHQIVSNSIQAVTAFANTAANTVAAPGVTAGTNTMNMTSATGYVVNTLVSVGTGLSTFDVVQYATVVTNAVTSYVNFVNAHSAAEVITKIRAPFLLRPASEARRDFQANFRTGALPGSLWLHTLYLRWIDPGNYIKVDCTWNGSTQYQTLVSYVVNGTVTTATGGLTNWTAAVGQTIHLQVGVFGANPTVLTIKAYAYSAGTYTSLAGPAGGVTVVNVTNANSTAVQVSGRQGLGLADTGTGFTYWALYDNTQQTIAVNDTNVLAGNSPYNVYTNGSSYSLYLVPGAYGQFNWSGSNLTALVDTSIWQASASSIAIKWSIDSGPWQYGTISPGATSLVMAANLFSGSHSVYWHYRSIPGGGSPDVWNDNAGAGPKSCLKTTGWNIDTGEAVSASTPRSKLMLINCNSLGIGPTAGDKDASPDPSANFATALARVLDAEYGNVSYGGQGWGWAGAYNIPTFFTPGSSANQTFDKYYAGQSRLVGGLLSPQPDYWLVVMGTNDGLHGVSDATVTANVTAFIAAARAAAPVCPIWIVSPFGGFKWTAIAAGVTAAADANVKFIQLPAKVTTGLAGGGASFRADDGIHPILSTEVELAAFLAYAIAVNTTSGTGGGSNGGRMGLAL